MFNIRYSYVVLLLLFIFAAACAGDQAATKKKAEALQQLGSAMAAEGNLRGALAKLLEAVKLEPDNADLNHQVALVLRNLGEYDLSLKYFQRALSLNPKFSEAQNNLGTLYLLTGNWDKAIGCFQEAANDLLYKTPQYAYNNMGYAYFKKGNYDKAIESYKQALRSSRSYTIAYTNLAQAYEAKGELAEAVSAYKQAVFYAPKDAAAHLGLGKVLLKLGRNKEAKEELNLAVWAEPTSLQANEAREVLKGIEN
ncbi:MAG: tetratricopeptide repeat protein [Deltaproteobacteria bacterium]|nr:tetratricopeptide repeat protein [Deltaproteobacteria bacterium]